MTAFFHVWHWLRSTDVLLAATLATILGAAILYTLARTTPGVRPGAPRDRTRDVKTAHAWRERDEAILRGELHAAAGRLFPDPPAHDGDGPSPAWPPDLCAYPPCSYEDEWTCSHHQCGARSPGGIYACTLSAGHAASLHENSNRTGTVAWSDDHQGAEARSDDHQGAERVGRHRAVWQGSLDDQPATVIVQAVTDVPYRRRPR